MKHKFKLTGSDECQLVFECTHARCVTKIVLQRWAYLQAFQLTGALSTLRSYHYQGCPAQAFSYPGRSMISRV